MEMHEFMRSCHALEEGDEIYLQKIGSEETGRLLFCGTDQFQVEVNGRREAWAPTVCEEVSSSSESPHSNL